jgi:hypothetical protein
MEQPTGDSSSSRKKRSNDEGGRGGSLKTNRLVKAKQQLDQKFESFRRVVRKVKHRKAELDELDFDVFSNNNASAAAIGDREVQAFHEVLEEFAQVQDGLLEKKKKFMEVWQKQKQSATKKKRKTRQEEGEEQADEVIDLTINDAIVKREEEEETQHEKGESTSNIDKHSKAAGISEQQKKQHKKAKYSNADNSSNAAAGLTGIETREERNKKNNIASFGPEEEESEHQEKSQDDGKCENMTERKKASATKKENIIANCAHNFSESSSKITLPHSCGRPRVAMNSLLYENHGFFAKFSQAAFCMKDGRISHLVLTSKWNKFARRQSEMQELYVGTGAHRERRARILAAVDRPLPLFLDPNENDRCIYYIGHWKPLSNTVEYFDPPLHVMGEDRCMHIKFKFCRYDDGLAKTIENGEGSQFESCDI